MDGIRLDWLLLLLVVMVMVVAVVVMVVVVLVLDRMCIDLGINWDLLASSTRNYANRRCDNDKSLLVCYYYYYLRMY